MSLEVKALEKINESIMALTQAVLKGVKESDVDPQNPVVAEAQMEVQHDDTLNAKGKVFMVEYLLNPHFARIYLAFKNRELRREWLRVKLEGLGKYGCLSK
ncbi:hypothetical protein K3495_g10901 [Podosphaera aphanis]|nr:hypothetical protein K3495_g10901 [Podosphaera aphanis]